MEFAKSVVTSASKRAAGFGAQAVVLVALATSGALGCGAAEEGDMSESVDSTTEAITRTTFGGRTWSQGSAFQDLGSSVDRACFLTGVKGAFEGGGEAVFVRVSGGRWQLGGQSGQVSIGGRANCVLNPNYTAEVTWSQGQAAKNLGSASDRVCFLTRVAGKLEGGGELVRTRISGASWVLDGTSQQVGVNAAARCLLTTNFSGELSWLQGAGSTALTSLSVQPNDFSGPACFLTRVKGAFEGGGEEVFVNPRDFGVNEVPRVRKIQWFLGGASQQQAVGASARCVF